MITVIVQYDQIATFRAGLNPTHPCAGIDVDPTGLTFEDRRMIADRLHATSDERSRSMLHYLCCGVVQDGKTKPQLRNNEGGEGFEIDPVFLPVSLPNLESLLEAVRADEAKTRQPGENTEPASAKPRPLRQMDDLDDAEEEPAAPAADNGLPEAPVKRFGILPPRLEPKSFGE